MLDPASAPKAGLMLRWTDRTVTSPPPLHRPGKLGARRRRICHSGSMSDEQNDSDRKDPKELMREALERKHASGHRSAEAANNTGRMSGGPHGPVGGKRMFRRKAGG